MGDDVEISLLNVFFPSSAAKEQSPCVHIRLYQLNVLEILQPIFTVSCNRTDFHAMILRNPYKSYIIIYIQCSSLCNQSRNEGVCNLIRPSLCSYKNF